MKSHMCRVSYRVVWWGWGKISEIRCIVVVATCVLINLTTTNCLLNISVWKKNLDHRIKYVRHSIIDHCGMSLLGILGRGEIPGSHPFVWGPELCVVVIYNQEINFCKILILKLIETIIIICILQIHY